MHTLRVDLGERSYPIYIGRDLFATPELLAEQIQGSQVVLVSNEVVAPLYADKVRAALGERKLLSEVVLPDGEQHKTMAMMERIIDRAMADGHSRNTTFVALGGGVVGDMTGFAAACYQRGVDFVQLPTTLLAQVDSSVGGKTGVNHPLGKNMIGAFHQPRAVLIDTDTLQTLPTREFAAGLAEVLKYGLICDAQFYRWLVVNMPRLLARDEAALAEAIERSCASKAAVVAADEREGGVRAILNLGHTFGHAIENHQGYGQWLHGEAVAAGMVMAARMSAARGWLSEEEVQGLVDLQRSMELPVEPPPEMSLADFQTLMARDKKVIDGRLRLVLLREIGSAVIVDDASEDELQKLIAPG
ncbi:3-dehydroquinate synthase [Parahaliea sp. F7430]|uniref:3-dehydroquinate synthase n=1 Tax=Sediminihaliea albiluteola TaxID=2758564 RepID=A0A7W2TXU6_9GAMM|nr:3-dehydroquinate synthase [Sediminihaliea albiluteola]MBA6413950.1 3-dehydroquinate synthase [Sediminihaliea albiluteola]